MDLYEAIIDGIQDGVYCLSLVDAPATEQDWVTLAEKDKKDLKFAIADEDQHLIYTVVMKADTPIYRRNGDYEYYIVYRPETIRKMAEKMMADNTINNFDLMHDGELLGKGLVSIQELYIVDEAKGIKPTFMDVPNGSLMCTLKVNDEMLWQMCKDGTFNGISLAGWFSVKEVKQDNFNNNKNNNKFQTMKKNIKDMLKQILVAFGAVTAEDGTEFNYDADELAVGVEVTDADGNALENGEYTIEGKVYTVADGKISDIKEVAVEEPAEEPEAPAENEEEPAPEPEAPVEPEANPEVENLKAEVEALKATVESLKATIEEIRSKLAEPAAPPVAEEFEKANPKSKSKAMALAEAMKG